MKRRKISYRGGIQNILLRVDSESKVAAVSPAGEVREHAVGLTLAFTQFTLVVRLHLCITVVIEHRTTASTYSPSSLTGTYSMMKSRPTTCCTELESVIFWVNLTGIFFLGSGFGIRMTPPSWAPELMLFLACLDKISDKETIMTSVFIALPGSLNVDHEGGLAVEAEVADGAVEGLLLRIGTHY